MSPAKKQPRVLQRTQPKVTTGLHGRVFHASRAPNGFNSDPPGFQTEKDPRKKGSEIWFDLPPLTGTPPYRIDLASILAEDAIRNIENKKRLVFHSVGDTGGVNTTTYQQQVAAYMELDFADNETTGGNPSFFYHLGDVVYYDGEVANYYWEFTSRISIIQRQSLRSQETTMATWIQSIRITRRQIR